MTFRDKVSHATSVAKWKADQQMRLLKISNQITEFDHQIRSLKVALADAALIVYAREGFQAPELVQICEQIAAINLQSQAAREDQERVKAEQAPELKTFTSGVPADLPAPTRTAESGLICPDCHRPLVGKFCPVHGVEGVYPEPPKADVVKPASGGLVCPVCQRALVGRFCPTHGVEGIPPTTSDEPPQMEGDSVSEDITPGQE